MKKKLFCEECGHLIPTDSVFCENCGPPTLERNVFCENCGHPIPPESIFCEHCGYNVNRQSENAYTELQAQLHRQMRLFRDKGWRQGWREEILQYGKDNVGLLILNDESWYKDDALYNSLSEYIQCRQEQGIRYYVADLTCDVWERTDTPFELLRTVSYVEKPKYCLLLGDNTTIPSQCWENPSYHPWGDDDKYVDSDLIYVTLDKHEPQRGQRWDLFDFDSAIRVGRIPCSREDKFCGATEYFKHVNTMKLEPKAPTTFAISAEFFDYLAKEVAKRLTNEIFLSPPIIHSDFKDTPESNKKMQKKYFDANVFYFLLHGSQEDLDWMGQRKNECKGSFPTAFLPDCLPINKNYVIGVEACYGAKPNEKESTLCVALRSGCLSFLGSRQIAYGSGKPDEKNLTTRCADAIVQGYLEGVCDGYTAGDAYMASLANLTKANPLDDTQLKTLAEFALYGDPSLCIFPTTKRKVHQQKRAMQASERTIHVPMPDVRREVKIRFAKVNAEIEAKLKKFVETKCKEFVGYQPNICEVSGTGLYTAVYAKEHDGFKRIMKIYFDEVGSFKHIYHSI